MIGREREEAVAIRAELSRARVSAHLTPDAATAYAALDEAAQRAAERIEALLGDRHAEAQRMQEARRGAAFGDYLRECPPEVDVRYLLDVAFHGQAHFSGCTAALRTVAHPHGACVCRLGMLREKYGHPADGYRREFPAHYTPDDPMPLRPNLAEAVERARGGLPAGSAPKGYA